jgi:hypothetical protein
LIPFRCRVAILAALSQGRAEVAALAPRLAACYKIAMSIGMGYMAVTTL